MALQFDAYALDAEVLPDLDVKTPQGANDTRVSTLPPGQYGPSFTSRDRPASGRRNRDSMYGTSCLVERFRVRGSPSIENVIANESVNNMAEGNEQSEHGDYGCGAVAGLPPYRRLSGFANLLAG